MNEYVYKKLDLLATQRLHKVGRGRRVLSISLVRSEAYD